jgi:hypothetical protein
LKLAEGFFLVPVTSALSGYNISPLRLIPPKAIPFQNKFVVFSGIIDEAPPMCKILRESKILILKLIMFTSCLSTI